MKKALIFSPYLDTLGGGERYTFFMAKTLVSLGYQVDLAWNDQSIINDAGRRFGEDFHQIHVNPKAYTILSKSSNIPQKYLFEKQFDLIFFLSDGSIPTLFAKKNFVHFQFPFSRLKISLLDNLKLLLVNKILYNSEFTKRVNSKHLPSSKSVVIYPPVDTGSLKNNQKKENLILSVGRFDSPSHSKRQDVLIDTFKTLPPHIRRRYQLILAGALKGDNNVLETYKYQAKGQNIKFVTNPDFQKLKNLYQRSKIFWHAAGYGVDEDTSPENVEHFGIVTVEAMAAGCIPVVIDKGGQKEIVTPKSGYLCRTKKEIATSTLAIIKEADLSTTRDNATRRAANFSLEKFAVNVEKLL